MNEYPVIHWNESGVEKSARLRSESGTPPPKRVVIADDTTKADDAYRLRANCCKRWHDVRMRNHEKQK
jgi:hypothetical protein